MNKFRKLNLEEKAKLTTGKDDKYSEAVGGIESILMLDGPHGMRVTAPYTDSVCYPPACLVAAGFDRNVALEMGISIAKQCQSRGIGIMLGPGLNIKRSPLCGRNFEYYSEDPVLAGEMATAFIKGAQGEGVAACPKHFLANNQEYRRRSVSAQVDERALHEIYMEGFRRVVQNAKPVTVMCSYNLLNGEQVAHSRKYLTDVLRGEWGYEGLVISDWGAVKDRVAAIHAGCDLTMPQEHITDSKIINAVKSGELSEAELDTACERIENTVDWINAHKKNCMFDMEKAHKKAQQIAEECIVLLKNEKNVLPLKKSQNVLFVGEFAEKPRFQGGGSSAVVAFKTTSAVECVKDNPNAEYCKGFDISETRTNAELLSEAVEKAKNAEKVVVFAGLPDNIESEGFDRINLAIPENQNTLIEEIAKVNKNIIVVLHNGAPVEMPWVDKVKGIVELYLGGQSVGAATVNVLYGIVNPSGRLPETFPKRLEDTPSYLTFPGDGNISFYGESIYVGYRYYEKKKIETLFPFGYGLSYTKFEYSNLTVDEGFDENGEMHVSVTVKNVGAKKGKEVVQLYIAADENIHRPVRELKNFDKIYLNEGESKVVNFTLTKRDFSYYNEEVESFEMPTGEYKIQICANAEEVILSESRELEGVYAKSKIIYTMHTPIAEVVKNSAGKAFVDKALPIFHAMIVKSGFLKGDAEKTIEEAGKNRNKNQGLYAQPLNTLRLALPEMTETDWVDLLDEMNK